MQTASAELPRRGGAAKGLRAGVLMGLRAGLAGRTTTEQLHTVLEANYNEITLTSAICSEGLRPHTLPL